MNALALGSAHGHGAHTHSGHAHAGRERKRTASTRSGSTGRRMSSSVASGSGTSPALSLRPLPPLRHLSSADYAASASSQVPLSPDERLDDDGFVFVNGDDTEVELSHRKRPPNEASPKVGELHLDRQTPSPPLRAAAKRLRPDVASHPLPAKVTLLPRTFRLGPLTYVLTRKRCEDILLLGALVVGIVQLGYRWNEWALVGELSTLLILSIAYVTLRVRQVLPAPSSPNMHQQGHARRSSEGSGFWPLRSRGRRGATARTSSPHHTTFQLEDDAPPSIGGWGCIWGTEEREYRDSIGDGALFALLLCPLTAAALLHAALTRLTAEPETATLPGWFIEPPAVIPTTPIRRVSESIPHGVTDAIRALSALAISRRNLVQLFTLLSFVLLVQLTWSLRHEVRRARTIYPAVQTSPNAASGSHSEPENDHVPSPGTYWLKRGEGRRNLSVIGFAFFVTACCVVVKIATAYIDFGVWSDMSHSDIIISTLFYQFCLYVCVRLARRGFTLGELGIVSHAATALVMETVNMTRMKIPLITPSYIKTYRLPTPLLIFQLALIPGSLLTGFLLSPLLYLSRHLAQRPVHRLRFPHEKPVHRRLLALAFYAGALLVVVGVVGTWARWCLGWRDPWFWVLRFVLQGRHVWTRPALISYWGGLALFSVAAWQRQLSRARRHRRYVVPGRAERSSSTSTTSSTTTVPLMHDSAAGGVSDGISAVATQMMDAADQRLPILSVNARRKSFHALAVAMFVPGVVVDPAFTHLSFSVAFAAFTFAEYIRYFALWPLGASVHLFLNEFIDHKDSGTAILSHFYLLSGCATPLWFEGPSQIMAMYGVLALGIGDAVASIVGRKVGYVRWSGASGKTVEGSVGFTLSVVATAVAMWVVRAVENFALVPFTITTSLVTLMEAFSAQNDNLVLPVYGWAVGILLGV